MKSERFGLLVILSSLVVIAVILGLLVEKQRDLRVSQIRAQGVNLARLLSTMDYSQLIPGKGSQGALELIKSTQGNSDYAYGVVVDPSGALLTQATATGVIVPPAPVPGEPASWFGERQIRANDGAQRFREFYAPLLDAGERVAHVRLGYLEPDFALAHDDLRFFALLALPIFLLAPAFYYLLKREVRPLRSANAYIQAMLRKDPVHTVQLEASGEVGEFIRNFNRVIRATEKRIQELETESQGMLASSKVISYQKARIVSVLDSLPDVVMVLDETGTVSFASHKIRTLLGVDYEDVIDRKPHEWCKAPELLAWLSSSSRQGLRRNVSGIIEFSPESVPGKQLSVSAYPLFSPKDISEIFGTLIVFRDITKESLVKQAQRDFLGHLAHEVKTPLHVIGMYSEMLREDENQNRDFQIQAANLIHDEAERLNNLVHNILNVTRIEMGNVSLEKQRTKLQELLSDTFATVARVGKDKQLELKLDLPPELSPVHADKDLLRVAITNLLTNAVKYNRSGGFVRLSAEESDDEIVISVRDNGLGITPEEKAHIFEKFYRSTRPEIAEIGGHGLGLALAKEIIEMHQGELRVESQPGEGTEFSLVFRKTPLLMSEAV